MIQALPGYTVAQLLRDDNQFVLLRAVRDADSLPVLVLVARDGGAAACARLEHEYALRAELDATWAAQPLALVRSPAALALVLADHGADPLAPVPGQALSSSDFTALAVPLALALSQLHRRELVHQDVRPEHVLQGEDGSVRLTGLGCAARLRALAPAVATGSAIYRAPELDGQSARAADARSDLYALGVLLYQMLCGVLPFAAEDDAQWARCHLAHVPPPPALVRPGVDPACAAVVMKLLEKCPEARYQSAAGLHADLLHCRDMIAGHGRAEPFALGCNDGAARLRIPDQLVGRAAELATLNEAARQAGASGTPELVIVSGQAGTGKSALIDALGNSAALAGARQLAARFEQHQREVPYATLVQALRKLVRQLLGQDEAALAPWRVALAAALGADAGVMVELIPELAFVIGPRPPPAAAGALEAEARLHGAFRKFLGVYTQRALLVLCLDDVQWIDPASLKLLTHLLTHGRLRRVLVVVALRAGESETGHTLTAACDSLRQHGVRVRQLALTALAKGESAALVAAALETDGSACAGLAALVYAKTGGNPFFTLQFLARLVESGLLRYDHGAAQWHWDAQAIGARAFSDNVVDLMLARLQQLPYGALELVKLLACLGHDAPLATIAQAAGMTALEADEGLWPAARLGLVARDASGYRFVHDRVHEAAYSLMTQASLPERHLHIAHLLLGAAAPDALEGDVFAVVGHLNRARAAIAEPAELARAARLNALAGARARRAVAFDAARHYYDQAASLTPESDWQDRIEETFALYSELAECEYLCGNLERAGRLFAQLAGHARSRLALARVALMRVALYQVSGRFDLAAAVALEALELFGIGFPDEPGAVAEALAAEQAAVQRHMAGRSIAALEQEPASTDPELAIVSELLSDMGSSVFSARPELYPLLAVKALNFTLRFGSTATSCMTYSRYAIMLVSLGAIPDAFAFSELALRLAERDGAGARRRGRLSFVHAAYVHCWRQPIEASVALLEEAHRACQEAGDLPHAGYSAHIAVWNSFEAGAALDDVQQRARRYQEFARQQNNDVLMQLLRCYEQLTLCLQGATGAEGGFDDERFSVAGALALMDKASYGAARARFHLMRQIAAFTFGRYGEALQAAEAAAADQHFFLASVNESTCHFYHALTLAALYPDAPRERQVRFMAALQEKQDKLRAWAGHCPVNFDNRYLLVSAEIARCNGRDTEAMRGYDAALASARAGGFVHHEALAAELAAAFYRQRGFDKIALAYARDALSACGRWGAYGKMRELERQYPGLVRVPSPLPGRQASEGALAPDLMAALRASQALSGELDGAALAAQLLRSALEHTGAARALLILPVAGGYQCVAQAAMQAGQAVAGPCALALEEAQLPAPLLQFVLRTRETVLLDDAQESAQFRDDAFIRSAGLRSVLCVPLLRGGVLAGVLYLENALAPGVFTAPRVLLMELICAQAAISLANADLVRLLGDENAGYRVLEASSARKAAFLCAMSDEARTPLGAIAALAALVQRGEGDSAQGEHAARIGGAAQQLLQMINDVLDLNRIDAGTLVPAALPFAPAALAGDVHAVAAARAGARDVPCRLELDPALPRLVAGDPLRIGQVLGILLDYVLAHSAVGPIGLAVTCEAQEGGIARIRFCVSGSGPGIGESHGRALCQPYSEAAQAEARAYGGSGLGLAIAQGLVARMGGDFMLDGSACSFTLALPCLPDPDPGRALLKPLFNTG